MIKRQNASRTRRYQSYLQIAAVSLSVFFSSAANAESMDIDTLLDRLIESYGGEVNLRKLDNQIQQWDVVALKDGRHGTDVRAIVAPDKLRVQLTYPDKKEIRIINGDASYASYGGEPETAVGRPQSDAMRLQMMRLYSPLILREKRDGLSLEADGEDHVLTLFEHGVRVDYLVNSKVWRIEKVTGGLAINGQEFRFVTQYSDFAFQDGVLVHRKENKFAGSVNTAILQLRQIALGTKLSDGHFSPHGAGSADAPQTL